jgi:1,4-alpha-glucan branching enzyme
MFEIYNSADFEKAYTYTGSDLGTTWSPEQTFFRLWAPTADSVAIRLYKSGNPDAAEAPVEENMEKSGDVESAGEDIQEQTAKPVKVIDPDGNVQEDNEDSWY